MTHACPSPGPPLLSRCQSATSEHRSSITRPPSVLLVARRAMWPASASICTALQTRQRQERRALAPATPPFRIVSPAAKRTGVSPHASSRRVAASEPRPPPNRPHGRLSSVAQKEWEPLKRPGRATASICLQCLAMEPSSHHLRLYSRPSCYCNLHWLTGRGE